jgi:hypothetical protein
MNIRRALAVVCLCVLMALPVLAQNAPQGAPPQGGAPPAGGAPGGGPGGAPGGGAPGGAGMPQTKTYKIDALFSGVDANKDGSMTAAELKAVGITDRFFTFCDPDSDNKIGKSEMAACKLPEAIDMNKDGALTVEEVVAYEKTPLGKERGPGEPKPE